MSPARSGATRRRSATCWRFAPTGSTNSHDLRARALPLRRLGEATADGRLVVSDSHFGNDAGRHGHAGAARQAAEDDARRRAQGRATCRPSTSPASTSRTPPIACCACRRGRQDFLISIGDRTVGGMTARDQMVGPWQVPVADCAVTTDPSGLSRRGLRHGRATPLALIDAPASGRMAVGEAVTNIAAAD
jgi:phosphoribosylformylglycinamidine synthase